MVKRVLKCVICDKSFTTKSRNAKYCSKECREKGLYKQRKKWEKENNYKEKQRKYMRNYRKSKKYKNNHSEKNEFKQKRRKIKEENEKRAKEKETKLLKEIKEGDPLARMQKERPQSIEYWEAYKDYHIEYNEIWNLERQNLVNGVSIYEPDFADKVLLTIDSLGYISVDTI